MKNVTGSASRPPADLRLEQPEEARLFQGFDRLGRDDPGVLGLLGALPQDGEQFGDPGDNGLRIRLLHDRALPYA